MNILLAERDPLLREGLTELLCGEGWEVQSVDGAHSLLGTVSSTAFDVVIMSEQLPGMAVRELCEEVKCIRPNQVILLLRDWGGGEHSMPEARLVDDCLRKPFGARELLAKLRQRFAATPQ